MRFLTKDAITKKRLEKAIKYTSWYNSESRGWRHIDLNFGDATPKDIGTSLFNQIGKPALFLAFDEGMSNIERPNILQYIPEEYREEVVDQGKFIIASTGVELLDIVTQGNPASMEKKWDRLGKNSAIYVASQLTEQGINFITNYTMGSEPSINKSAVRAVASLFAFGLINRAIKGKPNAANPACY